ncbi:HNH endonuclease [Sphingomonas sp. Leaf339]|uniref:HNH endonuclease n=1 Tax=Sphingomonas sp. Leaf339 TaxID=1736343 RepID=UPI0009E6778B
MARVTWYRTGRWQKLRLHQLSLEPLCRYCRRKGRMTAATVCDHIVPHGDNEARFWSGPFQSLCRDCHEGEKRVEEGRARARTTIGLDGWPTS